MPASGAWCYNTYAHSRMQLLDDVDGISGLRLLGTTSLPSSLPSMAPPFLFVTADFLVALACMPHTEQAAFAASPWRSRCHFGVAPLVRSSVLPQDILPYSVQVSFGDLQVLFNVHWQCGTGQVAIEGASFVLCGLQHWWWQSLVCGLGFTQDFAGEPSLLSLILLLVLALQELHTAMVAGDSRTLLSGGWQ